MVDKISVDLKEVQLLLKGESKNFVIYVYDFELSIVKCSYLGTKSVELSVENIEFDFIFNKRDKKKFVNIDEFILKILDSGLKENLNIEFSKFSMISDFSTLTEIIDFFVLKA